MKEKLVGALLLSTIVVTAQMSPTIHSNVLPNDITFESPFFKLKNFEKDFNYVNLNRPFHVDDIAVYITKMEAEKSEALLKKQKEIKIYCGGCDDKSVESKIVKDIKAEKVPNEATYWHVLINGKEEDMAYVYFKTTDGRWRSVALAAGIKVEGMDMNKEVTEYIPNNDLK